ncbi:lycopene cyclase domain-containing protein [Arcticibacter tournemirensis]|uniref:Lycopene cyclase domain-containing protein n=1 Tax=Arcticibacter tournemirensis TaxID=699437 RepID=A0A5M9H6I7_9SPHI|nr:lycopene cyclase domain-containing protein [Arcticibacter tournemirensis]KAA8482543.1 lycopene cyclase domain-containing protein [Arcticibacter tournemirensis]TQM52510.1 lycopene cyclase domain-containing protein [Arcticibacter tournemirensis]
MDKQYTYLLINFLTLFFPVVLSFDKRVQFYKKWKFIFPGLIITGGLFLLWDYLFTLYDVWTFNAKYLIGIYFLNLPLEEILFFITVPFACIFIYECLNYYVKKDILGRIGNVISLLMIALSIVMLVLYFNRVYTLITFGLLLFVVLFFYIKRPAYTGRFYLAYFISLIPFYIVNGLLTSLPVVMYNDAQNSAMRVGTIPFEDHFYSLSMLLVNILFFEYFRRRSAGAPI